MAFFGGIGGGVTRDILLNDIPGAVPGSDVSSRVRSDGFDGASDLSLRRNQRGAIPHTGRWLFSSLSHCPGLRSWARIRRSSTVLESATAILVGVIATNAGGVLIDIFSGVTPEIVKPSEQLYHSVCMAGAVYTLLWELEKAKIFLSRDSDRGWSYIHLPRAGCQGSFSVDRADRLPAESPEVVGPNCGRRRPGRAQVNAF